MGVVWVSNFRFIFTFFKNVIAHFNVVQFSIYVLYEIIGHFMKNELKLKQIPFRDPFRNQNRSAKAEDLPEYNLQRV